MHMFIVGVTTGAATEDTSLGAQIFLKWKKHGAVSFRVNFLIGGNWRAHGVYEWLLSGYVEPLSKLVPMAGIAN